MPVANPNSPIAVTFVDNSGNILRVPYVLTQSAVPSAIAPTGSMANNGAITLGTALPTTYSGGIYLNLPASAISAGSAAGSYWAVMSSTTVGTVFNNVLSGVPTVPAATVPFVTTGPGAYTGVTTVQNLTSLTLLGGTMGANGTMRIKTLLSTVNSANSKTISTVVGGVGISSFAVTTNGSFNGLFYFNNRGAQNINVTTPAGAAGAAIGLGGLTAQVTAIDTSTNQTIQIQGTLTTATEFIILDQMVIEIMYGP